jgi:hypothetical protein
LVGRGHEHADEHGGARVEGDADDRSEADVDAVIDLVSTRFAADGVMFKTALEPRSAALDLGAEHRFFGGVEGRLVGCRRGAGTVEPVRRVCPRRFGGVERSSGATGAPPRRVVELDLRAVVVDLGVDESGRRRQKWQGERRSDRQ